MLKNNKLFHIILIIVHVLIGMFAETKAIPKNFGLLVFVLSLVYVFYKRDANHEAFLCAGYMVTLEVFLRMTDGVIFYEYVKYCVIVLLFLGMLIKQKPEPISWVYFVYMLLLLIGIVNSDNPNGVPIRLQIAFNLSGPFVLGASAMYFAYNKIHYQKLLGLMFYFLLPLFSMVAYMYVKTPNIKDIVFGGVANGDMSGGFGPNQVATALGFGIFIITVLITFKKQITGFRILDYVVLIYFIYRGIMTFSRGGILAALICYIAFLFFMLLEKENFLKNVLKYVFIGLSISTAIWMYTSNITNGMIENRYLGKNASGVKKDITSGRSDIAEQQLESFYEAPLFGIGVGNGKFKRLQGKIGVTAASHNEITRLVEEHGLVGLFLLLALLANPISRMYKTNNLHRAFLLAFFLFWFLTINHSAMRIAFPGFIYGLSLLQIDFTEKEEEEEEYDLEEIAAYEED